MVVLHHTYSRRIIDGPAFLTCERLATPDRYQSPCVSESDEFRKHQPPAFSTSARFLICTHPSLPPLVRPSRVPDFYSQNRTRRLAFRQRRIVGRPRRFRA